MQNSLMVLFRAVIFLIVWEISVAISDTLKISLTVALFSVLLAFVSITFILAMQKLTPGKSLEDNIVLLVVIVVVSAILLSPMFLFTDFYSIIYLVVLLIIPGVMFSAKHVDGENLHECEEKSNDGESG